VTSFKNKGAGWVTPRIPLGDPMGVTYNSRKTHINSLKNRARILAARVGQSVVYQIVFMPMSQAFRKPAINQPFARVKEIDATGSHFSSVSAHASLLKSTA
jgi:hypothetical protein